jgi:hypothetical protein
MLADRDVGTAGERRSNVMELVGPMLVDHGQDDADLGAIRDYEYTHREDETQYPLINVSRCNVCWRIVIARIGNKPGADNNDADTFYNPRHDDLTCPSEGPGNGS